jgi:hypothetical protein
MKLYTNFMPLEAKSTLRILRVTNGNIADAGNYGAAAILGVWSVEMECDNCLEMRARSIKVMFL